MFLWHICLKSTSSKSFHSFWTRKKWLKILNFCLDNFKLQSWKIKLEKWHEASNKSEITGFYMGKNRKITGSFSWSCFMWHRHLWFLWCCFWSPYFFNRPFCGRPYCKTSNICISCWSRWFTSTNPKKLTAFTSPLSTSYTGEQSSWFLCNRWLLIFIHQPFCHAH